MKKYKLTEEHKAQLKPWAEKWIANAMSTKPMDEDERDICRKAVRGMYEAANLIPPPDDRIVFVPSPFVLRFASGFASAIWYLRKEGKSAATDDATADATVDATVAATADATADATVDATRAATADATADATRAATDVATADATRDATADATDEATYAATRDATADATRAATYNATRAATRAATDVATRAATDEATRSATVAATANATKNKRWFWFNHSPMLVLADRLGVGAFGLECAVKCYSRMYQGGNQWSGWSSFLTFFRYIAKLPIDYSKFDHFEKLSMHGGPRIMHEKFCMISDRPEVLLVDDRNRPHCETGPFCRWRDGSALYAIHGVRVPQYVVETPHLITVADIEAESNAEVRRIMIGRYKDGAKSYLSDSGAIVVHRSSGEHTHDGRTWSKERVLWKKDRAGDTPLVMVQVVNSTPEPDGSIKDYWLRIPPQITNADEAVAWTFGKTKESYQPTVES